MRCCWFAAFMFTIPMQTSSVANGQVAQANRTIVNWDVAAADWNKLKNARP